MMNNQATQDEELLGQYRSYLRVFSDRSIAVDDFDAPLSFEEWLDSGKPTGWSQNI